MNLTRFPCVCCGYLTLTEPPPGTYAVCPVCYWEDDEEQADNPMLERGANRVSLVEARSNFGKCGAATAETTQFVRKPLPSEFP